jgi:hypothetical protein
MRSCPWHSTACYDQLPEEATRKAAGLLHLPYRSRRLAAGGSGPETEAHKPRTEVTSGGHMPEIGDVLARRCRLLKTLGRGGMADVYRARDHEHGLRPFLGSDDPGLRQDRGPVQGQPQPVRGGATAAGGLNALPAD